MDDVLFAGPWIGEFGHEIMWVGMARAAAANYRRVIACSRPRSAALYADFAHEFRPHGFVCEGVIASATAATMPDKADVARLVAPEAEQFLPREYQGQRPAAWRRYGKHDTREAGLVVIHARSRRHVPARNWPLRNWNRLARLLLKHGIAKRLVCIGLKASAMTVEGARDLRDAPLQEQMDVLSEASIAIGPSSGPMHLASHCACPHVIWCGGGASERTRTQRRYASEWNPLGTPVSAHQVGSWQPSLDTVWGWVKAFTRR